MRVSRRRGWAECAVRKGQQGEQVLSSIVLRTAGCSRVGTALAAF
jgi:hypothetical protein